jgi:uncharacterized damage-inducible protein DinB
VEDLQYLGTFFTAFYGRLRETGNKEKNIMSDQSLETLVRTALWQQFGAAIDMLENALVACPDALWSAPVWNVSPQSNFPRQFAEFWHITFHVLNWLNLYLSGVPEEDFTLPAPFPSGELDSTAVLLDRPYNREELHAYLTSSRQQCRTRLLELSDEQLRQPADYVWSEEQSVSFLELQLYNLRHVQEHTAQLSLFLGQHGVSDEALDWVARAQDKR